MNSHHHRPQSVSDSSSSIRQPLKMSRRMSAKRDFCHMLAVPTPFDSGVRGVHVLGREKRRRRDSSPETPEMSLDPSQSQNSHKNHRDSRLATSPAEFNLLPGTGCSFAKPRCPKRPYRSEQSNGQQDNLADLTQLRSSAFWELRRSIAENGEGLVHRMREYEHSLSRYQINLKTKDSEKRGRKRISSRQKRMAFSDASEQEDNLIWSGSSTNALGTSAHGGRARSLDDMDVDDHEEDYPSNPESEITRSRSSPGAYSPNSYSDNEEDTYIILSNGAEALFPSNMGQNDALTPSLSNSVCESAR
ncbi:hypothetical protein B0H34DRAFT_39792 [Crassisporium funariophilum]|nr:hypothetical protein B0H34DRAFT_39792 [Crassisporium funariophilum]